MSQALLVSKLGEGSKLPCQGPHRPFSEETRL